MARSAHAYVRGSTKQFYQWLGSPGSVHVPAGPDVWICGDCHVGNLGPVASVDGSLAVHVRDLDQTVIGNPAHDLVRLGLSLAMAARGSDLPGITTARVLEELVHGYSASLREMSEEHPEMPAAVGVALTQSAGRSWRDLLTERLEDVSPTIPLGRNFWPLTRAERGAVETLFQRRDVSQLATSLRTRDDRAQVTFLDAAYWVKGCSSLGRLRLAVLLRIEGASLKKGKLCLIDVKEATTACAPASRTAKMPAGNAARVVSGARNLAPYLGDRMLGADLLGRQVVLRELLPQDTKFELDHLSQTEAIDMARFLGKTVGKAHGQQLERGARGEWRKDLKKRAKGNLDAPPWLWRSVVELVGVHEAAYLEHCRRFG